MEIMAPAKRPTIAGVARHVGVSKGSVSYALNGLPGVSEDTRRRILGVASDLGWQPNPAARALSGARAGALGLVLARPASTLGVELFYMQLISGIESELAGRSIALVLQVVADADHEIEAYARWSAQKRVDGIFLTDLRTADSRVAALEQLGLPAVVIGGSGRHGSLPRIWSDDAQAMSATVRYLAALGHRRIARVAGRPDFLHTQIRTEAFHSACAALGITEHIVVTDFSGPAGAGATRELLSSTPRPTALVFDNDVMAVAGLGVAHELGLTVPRDLSIVAWDDSVLCQLVHPSLTALARDISNFGRHAAQLLLASSGGAAVSDHEDSPSRLIPRASTGVPPRRS
jgi:DNA-binding LacI/PurR family transcriptional regulator